MHTIVIASRKGGSGKTTLAGHIGVEAERAGDGPIALVDTDPQGSLADWWNARSSPTPAFMQTAVARLADDVERLRALGFAWLIIDTPPAMTATIAEIVRLADLVVIPSRPSPHDLRSIGVTVDLVEQLGKAMVFVLNAATPRARVTGEAISVLSQHGTLAPVVFHQRVDFATSMIDGRTVTEIAGDSRSAFGPHCRS
jgi:chromosome partitioning protein